jgi:hypothetical protein
VSELTIRAPAARRAPAPVARPTGRNLPALVALALALALLAPAELRAAEEEESLPLSGLVSSIGTAGGGDVWVASHRRDGGVLAGRFSASGELRREVLLALPDADLSASALVVDRRGRLWLHAYARDADGQTRTWAVSFSSRGRLLGRFEITGWGWLAGSAEGEVYTSRLEDDELSFARLGPEGLRTLFSLPAAEYFGRPPGCTDQRLATAPLAGRRLAVLRTWASDGWLTVYDTDGSRLARWPFRTTAGSLHTAALAAGPGAGVTVVYRASFDGGGGTTILQAYREDGEHLSTADLGPDTGLRVTSLPAGGYLASIPSGTAMRLSPGGVVTGRFETDPPPDPLSWAEHATLRRALASLGAGEEAERWLEALLYGDRATSQRAAAWFVEQGAPALPVLLDSLRWELWPVARRVLATDPAAASAAVAHLATASPETGLAFVEHLSHDSFYGRLKIDEAYRDLLETVYFSGDEGRRTAARALAELPRSPRFLAHEMERLLGEGEAPYLFDELVLDEFATLAPVLDAAFAGPAERRERAVAVLDKMLERVARRSPAESPARERHLQEWGQRWSAHAQPGVALAGRLLAVAAGEAGEIPRLLAETLSNDSRRSAREAILRFLRFHPENLDEASIVALLGRLHCRECPDEHDLTTAIRCAIGDEDFTRAAAEHRLLPADEPIPDHVLDALTAGFPRFTDGELLAFLDDPRLRALPPSTQLAGFLDRVHRFAADRPAIQRAARELFASVFTAEAIGNGTVPEGLRGSFVAEIRFNPRHGHWLSAVEPAALHGLMDEVPDEVLAALEAPPNPVIARKMRVAWGLARFVETSGRPVPDHLAEWATSIRFDTPWSPKGPPEPPGLPGLLQRLDRMDAHRKMRWLDELDAERAAVEQALASRLDHPNPNSRATARVLLAEIGSARGRQVVSSEVEASIARREVPPAHLLAAVVLHEGDVPGAVLERAAGAALDARDWPRNGLTALAEDRLARHLRGRAAEEAAPAAVGAVRLLGALGDDLARLFLVELASHHRNPEVRAAARAELASF